MESSTDALTRKTAKPAYGEKANEIAETILFAKFPIQILVELAMEGTNDATTKEIKTFEQRQCQNAQLLLGTSGLQLLNQVYNHQSRQQGTQPVNNTGKTTTSKEVKRTFEGNCRYCSIVGRKLIECCKRLRDEANEATSKTQEHPLRLAKTQISSTKQHAESMTRLSNSRKRRTSTLPVTTNNITRSWRI